MKASLETRLLSLVHVAIILPMWPKHESPIIEGYVARKYKDGFGLEWCEFAPRTISELLQVVFTRRHALMRRPIAPASVTISRLSVPLLKHGA